MEEWSGEALESWIGESREAVCESVVTITPTLRYFNTPITKRRRDIHEISVHRRKTERKERCEN
jgi:hypothetical protein